MEIKNQTNIQLIIRKQGVFADTEFYFSISNAIERSLEIGVENCYMSFRDYVETDLTKYTLRNIISPNSKALVTYFNTDDEKKILEVSSTMGMMGFIENEDYTKIISIINTNTELFKINAILEYNTEVLVKRFFDLLKYEEKKSMTYSLTDREIRIEKSKDILDYFKRKEIEAL